MRPSKPLSAVRPMLAVSSEKVRSLTFPLLAQPKLDGIRALIVGGRFQSRSGKPIANRRIQALLDNPVVAEELEGLDGELIVGPPTDPHVYRRTASVVNSHIGAIDDLHFWAFDTHREDCSARERNSLVARQIADARHRFVVPWLQHLCSDLVTTQEELSWLERTAIGAGYEGIITRSPHHRYKSGRASPIHQQLVKFKRWEETELEVIGYEEQLTNQNEQESSPLGLAQRSSAQAGKSGAGVLGALICRHPDGGPDVRVGTGFTARERRELWEWPPLGALACVRYMPHGQHERLRHPSYKGLRARTDTGGDF